ncbi:hypothetical protein PIB30_092123 [Stylosanthes scabra]|uniref:Uncharacterized protein n=1 Tax=Stylosanthes scabra TaxID=79078 RepID=A0ABU6YU26_9FABA|nr:hypothetical protein [Stylosanthes scabra]
MGISNVRVKEIPKGLEGKRNLSSKLIKIVLLISVNPRQWRQKLDGRIRKPWISAKQKDAWKARKEENRATGQKQSYSNKNRGLTPRRHYPRLGVAKPPSPFSLSQHPTPRRDARRLGVDKAARKMTLHQGRDA